MQQKLCTLYLFETIYQTRKDNGLSENDYEWYRKYCTRRINRIHKILKKKYGSTLTQDETASKGYKFITAEHVDKDCRFLLLLLMNIERAWTYAIQLKNENNEENAPRKVHHLIRRLNKASIFSGQLLSLCYNKCDDFTCLEAEAYASWINCHTLVQKSEWIQACTQLEKSKAIFEKLVEISSPELNDFLGKMKEELNAFSRYCVYNISLDTGQPASHILDQFKSTSFTEKNSEDKLIQLLQKSITCQAKQAFMFHWKGSQIRIRSQVIYDKLLEIRDQREELNFKLVNGLSAIEKKKLLDKIMSTSNTISQKIHSAQIKNKQRNIADLDLIQVENETILNYLKFIKLQIKIELSIIELKNEEKLTNSHDDQPQLWVDIIYKYDNILQQINDIFVIWNCQDQKNSWEVFYVNDFLPIQVRSMEHIFQVRRTLYLVKWYRYYQFWPQSNALLEYGFSKITDEIIRSESDDNRKLLLEIKSQFIREKILVKAFSTKLALENNLILKDKENQLLPDMDAIEVPPITFDIALEEMSFSEFDSICENKNAITFSNDKTSTGWFSTAQKMFSMS